MKNIALCLALALASTASAAPQLLHGSLVLDAYSSAPTPSPNSGYAGIIYHSSVDGAPHYHLIGGTDGAFILSTGSYSNPSWITAIAGSKITGTVANATTATNFSGSLAGDVTGTQSADTVVAIQGNAVTSGTPSTGAMYIWSGTSLVPRLLLAADIPSLSATYCIITGCTFTGSPIPNADGTLDFGSTSARWNNGWFKIINSGGNTLTFVTPSINYSLNGSGFDRASAGPFVLGAINSTSMGFEDANGVAASGATPATNGQTASVKIGGDGGAGSTTAGGLPGNGGNATIVCGGVGGLANLAAGQVGGTAGSCTIQGSASGGSTNFDDSPPGTAMSILGGVGGPDTSTGFGGFGGPLVLKAGAGGSHANHTGDQGGGSTTLSSGAGISQLASEVPSASGGTTVTTDPGGNAITTARTGGASGNTVVGTGNGGNSTGTGVAGASGSVTMQPGNCGTGGTGSCTAGAVQIQAGAKAGSGANSAIHMGDGTNVPASITIGQTGETTTLGGTVAMSNTPSSPSYRPGKTTNADVADSNNTNKIHAWSSITAARAWTGSCATGSTTNPIEFVITDESGNASGTLTLSVTPSSGTIDGGSTKVAVNSGHGVYHFYANGTNCFSE